MLKISFSLLYSAHPTLHAESSLGPSTIDLKNRKKRKAADVALQEAPPLVVTVDDETESFYQKFVSNNAFKNAKSKKMLVLYSNSVLHLFIVYSCYVIFTFHFHCKLKIICVCAVVLL